MPLAGIGDASGGTMSAFGMAADNDPSGDITFGIMLVKFGEMAGMGDII